MKLIKCDKSHLESVTELYRCVIGHLEENINFPKWSAAHPSDLSIAAAVSSGEQYVCLENGKVLGTVVLSENPEGDYSAGDWSRNLKEGEYLVIHALAVSPVCEHRGVGGFMVEECAALAAKAGYRAVRLDVVPGNIPAVRLYQKHGFAYAGTKDLNRNIEDIPFFELYERNI